MGGDMNNSSRMTGWVALAAMLMIVQGVINFIYGLAALANAHWYAYAQGTVYWLNISNWGWAVLLVGLLLIMSGFLLWSGNMFGRIMGVIFAVASFIANLNYFPVAPAWTTLALVLDVVIIYAILAHGKELKHA
jgi:hypothetical protein